VLKYGIDQFASAILLSCGVLVTYGESCEMRRKYNPGELDVAVKFPKPDFIDKSCSAFRMSLTFREYYRC
jgi:hypothetical protein